MPPDRAPPLLKFGLLVLGPALALGSCSGVLLGEFTVSGIIPFHGTGSAAIPAAQAEPGEYGWPKLGSGPAARESERGPEDRNQAR